MNARSATISYLAPHFAFVRQPLQMFKRQRRASFGLGRKRHPHRRERLGGVFARNGQSHPTQKTSNLILVFFRRDFLHGRRGGAESTRREESTETRKLVEEFGGHSEMGMR